MRDYRIDEVTEDRAEEVLGAEGNQEFYVLRLVVDKDGGIRGAGLYSGEKLSDADHPKCAMVSQILTRAIPDVVEAAEAYMALRGMLDKIAEAPNQEETETKETDDNSNSKQDNDESIARAGQLKQHGTIIH